MVEIKEGKGYNSKKYLFVYVDGTKLPWQKLPEASGLKFLPGGIVSVDVQLTAANTKQRANILSTPHQCMPLLKWMDELGTEGCTLFFKPTNYNEHFNQLMV